jgi:hypothetical protein
MTQEDYGYWIRLYDEMWLNLSFACCSYSYDVDISKVVY